MTVEWGVHMQPGARVRMSDGDAVGTQLARDGVHLRTALGEDEPIAYDWLAVVAVTDTGVQAVQTAIEPWWSGLCPTRAEALLRLEVLTGHRDGEPASPA